MTILATRTDVVNYALASHEAMAADLRIGDILDIAGGMPIVRIGPWQHAGMVIVYTEKPGIGLKIRSYRITDIVSVLV